MITLGLTATPRYANPPLTNNGAGTFYATPGGDTLNGQPGYAMWNFDFYANAVGTGSYILEILYDTDPGVGTSVSSMGVVRTILGGGSTIENSWNLGMGFLQNQVDPNVLVPPTYGAFNPSALGQNGFILRAKDLSGNILGQTQMQVQTAQVPEPASLLLSSAGFFGAALFFRRRKQRAA